ncbi:hypothetical protein BN14_07252 [Rhizoctonia solani AG-1 IB]|uniref:Uncharacterized protein n=1 Tax=Thanatephorus cucumeris (strain AG1-IB / isolate 7/3/14) TaxID=1108050 RepID=M5C2E1_THACB|nr:hypothetical protein BN14_07252 [Rhizoctonia solani AG-1 IB]
MEYVFRYMCCGALDDLFDDIDFAHSTEEFVDFVFQVMSAANELMLEQLTEACSKVILRHVTLTNCITILANASPFHCPKLKARLQNYITVNMESLMEKQYLNDVAHDIMKELAAFVRGQQAAKQPHVRSGAWIEVIMDRHREWLSQQDFPSVVVRAAAPGRQPKSSPKSSPTMGPVSPKTPRRVSSFNLPVTPQRSATSKQPDKTPQSDGMFTMDEEGDEPTPARDSSTGVEALTTNLAQLPPITSSPGLSSRVWKGSKAERVDMRSIMANEAASSRPARSPMQGPSKRQGSTTSQSTRQPACNSSGFSEQLMERPPGFIRVPRSTLKRNQTSFRRNPKFVRERLTTTSAIYCRSTALWPVSFLCS